jgi:L-ascorbate metabolism protein UlaG (beta-lactamase superfamily)
VKILTNLKKTISRRQFIGMSCLGAAATGGWWVSGSNRFAARFIRDRFTETGKSVNAAPLRPDPAAWNSNAITVSWLGHATALINFYGFTILTDPALFNRIGANIGIGTLGPKRLVAPALTPKELPKLDLVLLSHAHMDHFDFPTLNALPSSAPVVTAKSTADLFGGTQFKQVNELRWGQSTRIDSPVGSLNIQAFQVNHWGARWRRDTYRGYNGYILEREGRKIIFGGDTAYCSGFADLRSKGPFDIAIMPIGSYAPWTCSHCTPEQALWMANAAHAKYLVPIHHRTFKLGKEGPVEPLERLQVALQSEPERIAIRDIGGTFTLAA